MKYFLLSGICFVLSITSACTNSLTPNPIYNTNITPIILSSPTSTPTPLSSPSPTPTQVYIPDTSPSPVNKLNSTPLHVPEQLSKYVSVECSYTSVIEGYTSQMCYAIDSESNTFGVVYYKGDLIKAVAAYQNMGASSDVSTQVGHFQGYVAAVAGWDASDMLQCVYAITTLQNGDSQRCGNYTVSINISSDGGYLVILFVED